jgi:hypothetical protein
MEATGTLYEAVALALSKAGHRVSVVNPPRSTTSPRPGCHAPRPGTRAGTGESGCAKSRTVLGRAAPGQG